MPLQLYKEINWWKFDKTGSKYRSGGNYYHM